MIKQNRISIIAWAYKVLEHKRTLIGAILLLLLSISGFRLLDKYIIGDFNLYLRILLSPFIVYIKENKSFYLINITCDSYSKLTDEINKRDFGLIEKVGG